MPTRHGESRSKNVSAPARDSRLRAGAVDAVNLNDTLGNVEPNRGNVHPAAPLRAIATTITLAHQMPKKGPSTPSAKQSRAAAAPFGSGLLRRFAPRNDGSARPSQAPSGLAAERPRVRRPAPESARNHVAD